MKCQWCVSVCTVFERIQSMTLLYIFWKLVLYKLFLCFLSACACFHYSVEQLRVFPLVLYCHLVVSFGFLLLLKKQNSSTVKTFSASPLSPSCEVLSRSVHIKLIDLS